MRSESAACQQDSKREDVGTEPVVGTLVAMSRSGNPLVELDGPDGELRRCTALAGVPVEADMVGRPVALTFVGDLDQPVITRVIDVRDVLRARWDALGRKVLGLDPGPRKLSVLTEEMRVLACTAAWFEANGSITHGAACVGTSRRSLRVHVRRWTAHNPRLVPAPGLKPAPGLEPSPVGRSRPRATDEAAPSSTAEGRPEAK